MVHYEFYMSYYAAVYPDGAALTSAEWDNYGRRAEDQLLLYKRLYTVSVPADLVNATKGDTGSDLPYAESMAVCAMAEALANFDIARSGVGGPVTSASIGSVSVGYGSAVSDSIDLSPKGQAKELYRCACRYLDIYRGVG